MNPLVSLSAFLKRYSKDERELYRVIKPLCERIDIEPKAYICKQGEAASAYWLILEGQVDLVKDGQFIRSRGAGDLIGEQAFLSAKMPCGEGTRSADMIAHGHVKLLCFNDAFEERLTEPYKASWFEIISFVVNEKLKEATDQRSDLVKARHEQDKLLSRFCDPTALGRLKLLVESNDTTIAKRNAIVWFSDMAGFSAWAADREPEVAARMLQQLLGMQATVIMSHRGCVDKFMGDGLLAYWFCDGSSKLSAPLDAISCALEVCEKFKAITSELQLDDRLGIRIGMHVGDVAFGDFGNGDRVAMTILGATVNTASRYEQLRRDDGALASLGRVRISAELKAMLDGCSTKAPLNYTGPIETQCKGIHLQVYWLQ